MPAGSIHKSRYDVRCVCVCLNVTKGHSGDGYDLALTLCKYDLRKGNLFVLRWARGRQVRRGIISSEMQMCGRSVRYILLLHPVSRFLEEIDVCIWRMFILCLL